MHKLSRGVLGFWQRNARTWWAPGKFAFPWKGGSHELDVLRPDLSALGSGSNFWAPLLCGWLTSSEYTGAPGACPCFWAEHTLWAGMHTRAHIHTHGHTSTSLQLPDEGDLGDLGVESGQGAGGGEAAWSSLVTDYSGGTDLSQGAITLSLKARMMTGRWLRCLKPTSARQWKQSWDPAFSKSPTYLWGKRASVGKKEGAGEGAHLKGNWKAYYRTSFK